MQVEFSLQDKIGQKKFIYHYTSDIIYKSRDGQTGNRGSLENREAILGEPRRGFEILFFLLSQ